MTKTMGRIAQWGNGVGIRLPARVVKAADLRLGQRMQISVENGAMIIRPHENDELSLEERLACFDPLRHGGEFMADSFSG